MSDITLRVARLGKQYRLGVGSGMTLYDVVRTALRMPFQRRLGKQAPAREGAIWALKDVSFDVRRGEVVGIVGRNGAGKSTLLKILSGITEPTEGTADLYGRVTSLLEIGTGFHPELTGRENIFLNGAILGMGRADIIRRLDEIVAFAEIDRFLDTPVKHYSSGMYLRLAFAVAAHLEPEFLLVDEVLAVGDAAFQRKCLGRMGDAARLGRTVLFVSHNLPAILHLCPRALLFEAGRLVLDGAASGVVERYLQSLNETPSARLETRTERRGNGRLRFYGFAVLANRNDRPVLVAACGQPLRMLVAYRANDQTPLRNVHVAIGIYGRYGEKLLHLSTSLVGDDFPTLPAQGTLVCRLPRLPLQPGRYHVNLWANVEGELADWLEGAASLDVVGGDYYGSGRLPPPGQGYFLADHSWDMEQASTHLFPSSPDGREGA